MSDILLAMREFRALDDKRRLGGLTAEEELRWLDLRATVKGDGPVPLGRIPLVPGAKARKEPGTTIEPVRPPPVKADEVGPEIVPPLVPEVVPPVAPPEFGPEPVPVWTAPEFLPFEVSRITYLPGVDEEALAEGFATLPPEGEAPVEKTFGPGQPFQVPWEASQVEQPFPTLEPILPTEDVAPIDPPPSFHHSAESAPVQEGFGPGTPGVPTEFVPPLQDLEEPSDDSAEFVQGISLADLLDPAPFHETEPAGELEPVEGISLGDLHDSAESWETVEGIPLDDLLDAAEFPAPVQGVALDDLPPDDPVELSLDDLIEDADPADFVSGTHRVVVHTRGGVVKRGHIADTALTGPTLALQTQSGAVDTLPTDQLQVIFFMRDPETPEASRATSRTIRVVFPDGRPLQGTVEGAPEGPGFFLIPADTRGNTSRIWVYREAVRDIVWEPT